MWHRLNNSIDMLIFRLSSVLSGNSIMEYLSAQNAGSWGGPQEYRISSRQPHFHKGITH